MPDQLLFSTKATLNALMAGLLFAAMLLAAGPVGAATLEDLMDACVQVMEQGDYRGVADYGVLRMSENDMGSTQTVDGGTVTLVVQKDWRDDRIFGCAVLGYTKGVEATIRDPGLTWGAAEGRIRDWFDGQMTKPGYAEMSKGASEPPFIGASCIGAGEGFFVRFGPGNYGSKAAGAAEKDVPFEFWAVRSANKPEQACELYKAFGPGG